MNRIIFVGAVELSLAVYQELLNYVDPVLLVTLAPKYSHRHSDYASLKEVKPNIPYLEVDQINDHASTLKSFKPDYILVWGWSQLISQDIIDIPAYGSIGLHPAPLPKNRGRAVIPWTILTQSEAGLTMFYIDEGVDAGDIVCQRKFQIEERETARTLYDKMKVYGIEMLQEILPDLLNGEVRGVPQDSTQANYFAKRIPSDGLIDWTRSSEEIDRLIRATTDPYPGAFTTHKGNKLVIWEAHPVDSLYRGVPGQLVEKNVVQCGTGHLKIDAIGGFWGKKIHFNLTGRFH